MSTLDFSELYKDVTKNGTKIPQEMYLDTGDFLIVDQGKQFEAGRWNDGTGIFQDVPAIIFGDHTRVVKYVEEPFFIGADGVKILRPAKDTDNPKYLFYALQAAHIPDLGYSRHFKALKELKFCTYDREKQDSIVENLDAITSLISKRRQQLTALDDLVKSRFIEMFGDLKSNSKCWPIAQFTECAEIDTNMIHDFDGYEDYPHIGIDSIEKETGRIAGYRTVAEDGVISGKYLFTPEHIIYSKIRPNLNKVAMPDFAGVCSADAYPILVKPDVCVKEYLAYTMRSKYFLDYILAFSNRTNLPKVNKNQVEGFSMPLPPLKLQTQFADFVTRADRSKAAVQQGLQELETLKKSLMQQYFG